MYLKWEEKMNLEYQILNRIPVLYSKSLRALAEETADKINQRKIYLYFTKPIYTGL